MKSIRARLIAWYAASATLTLAGLFVVGYQLLESRLIHGLDLLNRAEFEQIKAHLGPNTAALTSEIIDQRIRETTEYASVLFYIEVDSPQNPIHFYSRNLNGRPLPDTPGKHVFDGWMDEIGPLRLGEFFLPPFDITIATSATQVRQLMRGYVEVCAALLLGMLLASIAIGAGLSRLVLRPVRLIRETASRIGSDNLGERIPVADVHDEISDMARLLNEMFDRLETSFNQIRRFTAEASHELKTPLSLVRLHAEKLLAEGILDPAHEEAVLVQLEEVARLNKIIDELLFLSRAEAQAIPIEPVVQDPAAFLESFRPDAAALAEHVGCRFALIHEGDGLVSFDPKWLRQVLLNLLTNAIKASSRGGLITLRSTIAGHWRVVLEDQGTGVPPDQYERIFERFVRLGPTSLDDRGSGLGLAICRSIIRLHQGHIFAEPGPEHVGFRVIFEIPAAPGAHADGIREPARPSAAARRSEGFEPPADARPPRRGRNRRRVA